MRYEENASSPRSSHLKTFIKVRQKYQFSGYIRVFDENKFSTKIGPKIVFKDTNLAVYQNSFLRMSKSIFKDDKVHFWGYHFNKLQALKFCLVLIIIWSGFQLPVPAVLWLWLIIMISRRGAVNRECYCTPDFQSGRISKDFQWSPSISRGFLKYF